MNTTLTLVPGDKVIVKQSAQRNNEPRFKCGEDATHAKFLRMDKRGRYIVQFGTKTRRLRLTDILIHETRRANEHEIEKVPAPEPTAAKQVDDTETLIARLKKWSGK